MSKALSTPRTPIVDLAILKDTICYMHDDVRHVAGLQDLARALDQVLIEIDRAEEAAPSLPAPSRVKAARFLPIWR